MAYTLICLLKKKCKSYSHFSSKNTCGLDIVLTRTVNILITNELIKLNNWAQNTYSTSFEPLGSLGYVGIVKITFIKTCLGSI